VTARQKLLCWLSFWPTNTRAITPFVTDKPRRRDTRCLLPLELCNTTTDDQFSALLSSPRFYWAEMAIKLWIAASYIHSWHTSAWWTAVTRSDSVIGPCLCHSSASV